MAGPLPLACWSFRLAGLLLPISRHLRHANSPPPSLHLSLSPSFSFNLFSFRRKRLLVLSPWYGTLPSSIIAHKHQPLPDLVQPAPWLSDSGLTTPWNCRICGAGTPSPTCRRTRSASTTVSPRETPASLVKAAKPPLGAQSTPRTKNGLILIPSVAHVQSVLVMSRGFSAPHCADAIARRTTRTQPLLIVSAASRVYDSLCP